MPTESINPWENRADFPRLDVRRLLPLYLAVLASSVQLAFFEVPFVSYILLPVLLLYIAITVRFSGVAPFVIVTVVVTTLFSFSLTVPAVFLALVVGGGSLAVLFTTHRSILPTMLILSGVFGLAWAVTGDWQLALAAFAALPAGILLAYATADDRGRTSIICWGTAGFLLSLLVLGCFILYRIYGELNKDILFRAFDDAQNGIRYTLANMRDELIANLRETNTPGTEETIAVLNQTFSNNVIKVYTSAFFSIIPALAVMLCSILAFTAQLLQGLTYRFIGWEHVLTRSSCAFTMSALSAVLYDIGFLVTLLFGGGNIVVAVFNNICFMLLPGFCVLGAGALVYRIRTSRGGKRWFLILFCVGSVLILGVLSIFVLGLWGAAAAMTEALRRRFLEKLQKHNGSDHSDDSDDSNGFDGR